MLRQILFAVPCGLVAVEHGPGLGVVYHGPHEFRGGGQPLLHPPQFPGQGVGPPTDHRLHVLQAVAVPQGGGPEPCGPVLAWESERDHPAPAPLHLDARLLHPFEEVGKVGGPVRQDPVYDPPYLLLVGGGPGRAQPLAIVLEFPLAVELGVFDNGQVMLQAYPVGQPPQGAGGT